MTVGRSYLVLAAGTLAAGATAWATSGDLAHGAVLAVLLLASGVTILTLSHLFARRRAAIGSLQRQFRVALALASGLVLLALGAMSVLMFLSPAEVIDMGLVLLFAGGLAALSASLLGEPVMRDVERVRDALVAVGEGRREAGIETAGTDEIAELAEAANRMIERLAEEEERRDSVESARRDLVAAVSHDLRTPLASLQLLAEAIEGGVVDDETRRRYLRQMSVHIRSLSALIDDLFELSRLESGDIQWSLQQVQLEELVEETVDAMRAEAESKRIAVEARVPGGLGPARANPEKVQRVLFNLIQNAIRHTPADGSVTVAAEDAGSVLEVEVADTGGGIEPGQREQVFEPFFRDGARGRADGDPLEQTRAGLGLTICRAIVEAHGGRIWLADSSRGTRVRFSLPRAAQ